MMDNDFIQVAILIGIAVNFIAIISLPVKLERRLTRIEVTQQFIVEKLHPKAQ